MHIGQLLTRSGMVFPSEEKGVSAVLVFKIPSSPARLSVCLVGEGTPVECFSQASVPG